MFHKWFEGPQSCCGFASWSFKVKVATSKVKVLKSGSFNQSFIRLLLILEGTSWCKLCHQLRDGWEPELLSCPQHVIVSSLAVINHQRCPLSSLSCLLVAWSFLWWCHVTSMLLLRIGCRYLVAGCYWLSLVDGWLLLVANAWLQVDDLLLAGCFQVAGCWFLLTQAPKQVRLLCQAVETLDCSGVFTATRRTQRWMLLWVPMNSNI